MNSSDYRAWLKRAFLFVEGRLLIRSAEESPTRITEDFVRGALIDGLKASKPEMANEVLMEQDVPWNTSANVHGPALAFGTGRAKQHDVAVKRNGSLKLACEVKWLKIKDADAIIEDIWKLALTHGVAPRERDACRTFMLIGGLKSAFQDTLRDLRAYQVPLRWSPQGRANGWPRPTAIGLGNLANKTKGFKGLKSTLKRRDGYYRTPPVIWWELRSSVLDRSWKTIRGADWKIVLCELDFHSSVCGSHQVDWSDLGQCLP
jgi:hypothetical protein